MSVSSRGHRGPHRRDVLKGVLKGAAAALPLPLAPAVLRGTAAMAQTPAPNVSFWHELGGLAEEAGRLGYATPRF